MSNLHRVQWIDSQIRRGAFPNCSDIAKKFEITARQASRDIEYLRYSLCAPVEYDSARNGYFYSGEEFILSREHITESDAGLLEDLADSYRSIGTERASRIAELFSRIYSNENRVHPEENERKIISVRTILETCLKEEKDAYIEYIDAGGARTERNIRPLRVFQWGTNELVEAWCHSKGASRQFRIDRIRRAEPRARESGLNPDEEQETAERILIKGGGESIPSRTPFEARIRPEGLSNKIIVCSFYNSSEILGWLINSYSLFEILSPSWLREKAVKRMETLIKMHSS